MATKLITLLAVIGGTATFFAQENPKSTKAGEGTLMVDEKNYPLSHAVAYETTINDEDVIAVVLSGSAVSAEKLKEAREAETEGNEGDFNRPFLKLEFSKAGELRVWSANAGNTSLGRRSGNATGELKVQDGRVIGKANQPNETEGMFPSGFDVRFDVPLLKPGESLPASAVKTRGPAANVKPSVTGTFKGNGKEAKLAFVSARWREPFNDKPGMLLLFTEKDHSKIKKPDFDAAFGKLGSALVISMFEEGGIFGCQVVHTAHQKQGFTSIGSIEANNFSFEDGKVEGELATEGEVDTFGEKWELNIKFVAPLGEIPKEFQPAESKKSAADSKKRPAKADADEEDDDDDDLAKALSALKTGGKTASQPAADQLNVKHLALTKDASGLEYKEMVGHVLFKSKSSTKAVCTELDANLKAQGWTKEDRDLITPASSILKRKRGEASLTIFVKPEDGGSDVKMFTEGLSWD